MPDKITYRANGRSASRGSAVQTLFVLALAVLAVPALLYTYWLVHQLCDRLCVRHSRRYCRRVGLEPRRVWWRPEFEPSGVKTEYTLVQLDCLDAHRQRKLVTLLVWPLGVRKAISEEPYPESDEGCWQAEPA